jgi:DDE superfamily endonuclease
MTSPTARRRCSPRSTSEAAKSSAATTRDVVAPNSLDFMNQIVAARPEREIPLVLDNLSTHKPKRDLWLTRHKNVHFHDTPTRASWLKPDRNLVLHPDRELAQRRLVHQRRTTRRPHQRLHRRLQPNRQILRLDQIPSPPKPPQTLLRRTVILGTSFFAVMPPSWIGSEPWSKPQTAAETHRADPCVDSLAPT